MCWKFIGPEISPLIFHSSFLPKKDRNFLRRDGFSVLVGVGCGVDGFGGSSFGFLELSFCTLGSSFFSTFSTGLGSSFFSPVFSSNFACFFESSFLVRGSLPKKLILDFYWLKW